MNKYATRLVEDNASISKRRSYIPFMKHTSQLDFNAGVLVPLSKPWEVLPSDTWKVGHSLKLRMSNPPKVPPFGQLVFDLFYFFVPYRVVWSQFDQFITGDTGTDWEHISTLTVPTIESKLLAIQGSLADYLGVPLLPADYTGDSRISALPFRSYYSIWNRYFRFQPLQEELYFNTGSTDILSEDISTSDDMDNYFDGNIEGFMDSLRSNAVSCGCLAPVNKLDDFFTRCLPSPAAGPDVNIIGGLTNPIRLNNPFMVGQGQFPETDPEDYYDDEALYFNANGTVSNSLPGLPSSDVDDYLSTGFKVGGVSDSIVQIGGNLVGLNGNTLRELRQAMAIDLLLTNDARYGRRITESTYAHYGCVVPDFRVDFPEFLGTKRIYINVNQVIQSSSSVSNSPQGNVGAWSETTDSGYDFTYSACEHGVIMALGCVRILNRIYSQGMDKMFRRFTRFDFYTPELANISDTPVYTRQIYLESDDDSVFGYQEAWADYRYLNNHIANHMRPYAQNTLAVWNYAESYDEKPTLSEAWIIEDPNIIDRTMYLEHSATVSQFILDAYWDIDCYRTMPLHSLPGGFTNSW